MTSDTQMYRDRCHIFKTYFSSSMTVAELCKRFGRSRTWYYKWLTGTGGMVKRVSGT